MKEEYYVIKLTDSPRSVFKQAHVHHQDHIKVWVKGLRSGDFTQAHHQMVDPQIPNSACCLMVAEMVVNNRPWTDHMDKDTGKYDIAKMPSGLLNGLSWTSMIFAEIWDSEDCLVHRAVRASTWNDKWRLTFSQIANLLEYGELIITANNWKGEKL